MDRKQSRGDATQTRIVDAATELFTRVGYEQTSIEAVLAACDISRGALYHHFDGKEALFTAVLERLEARVAAEVSRAAQGASNPLDALRAGCRAWLNLAARDVEVRRIVLIEAPAVIGWRAWREIDARFGLGLLKAALAWAANEGRFPRDRVDLFAHMLLANLTEAAMLLARSDTPADRSVAFDVIEQILSRLLGFAPHARWEDDDLNRLD